MTKHLLTALLTAAASLAGVHFLPIADQPSPQTTTIVRQTADMRVTALQKRIAHMHVVGCADRKAITEEVNARGKVLRTFILEASDARMRAATAEVNDPAASTRDWQAANGYQKLAEQVHDLPAVTC